MRSDMHKVIVERPRILRGGWTNKKTSRRLSLDERANAIDSEDYDSGASRASSRRHAKWLNENLAPLKRYLAKQVGRPWDKVYGEIRETIDTRSAVGLHVLQHLEDFVSMRTVLKGGAIYGYHRFGGLDPVHGLYVHPVTGLLRATKDWQRRKPLRPPTETQKTFLPVSLTLAYEKVKDCWFRNEYRRVEGDEIIPLYGTAKASQLPTFPEVYTFLRKQQCDRKTVRRIECGEIQEWKPPCGVTYV